MGENGVGVTVIGHRGNHQGVLQGAGLKGFRFGDRIGAADGGRGCHGDGLFEFLLYRGADERSFKPGLGAGARMPAGRDGHRRFGRNRLGERFSKSGGAGVGVLSAARLVTRRCRQHRDDHRFDEDIFIFGCGVLHNEAIHIDIDCRQQRKIIVVCVVRKVTGGGHRFQQREFGTPLVICFRGVQPPHIDALNERHAHQKVFLAVGCKVTHSHGGGVFADTHTIVAKSVRELVFRYPGADFEGCFPEIFVDHLVNLHLIHLVAVQIEGVDEDVIDTPWIGAAFTAAEMVVIVIILT